MNSSPNDSMQINEPIQSTTLLIRNYPSLVSQPNKVSGNMKELGVGLDPDSPPKTVFVSKMNKIAKKLEMAMKNPQLEKKLAFFKEKYCDIEMRATPLDHSTPFIKRNSTHKTDNNIEKDPRKSFNEQPVFGPIFYDDGSTYIGQFKKGQKFGFGKLIYSDGSFYLGEWMNDLRWGRGTFGFKTGDIFIGRFSKDAINGQGNPCYFKNPD